MNAAKFCIFLQELYDHLEEDRISESLIIMDNSRIHNAAEVMRNVETLPMAVKCLPPYSPILNPVEHVFLKIESCVHARTNEDHNIVNVITCSVSVLTPAAGRPKQ